MEWIKAKYDRLLLVFGVIALLVGGLLVTKVVGSKGQSIKGRPEPKCVLSGAPPTLPKN